MMMRNLLLMVVLLAGVTACSQPTLSIKAFKQHVLPGTVPVRISDNEPPSDLIEKRSATNYYFYLVYPKAETIQPQLVWINKKAYTVKAEPVAKTPVERTIRTIPTQPVTKVLVAKTSSKVVRLVPAGPAAKASPSATAKKLMATSELVVSYKWRGKTYHKAVKKITELDPEMNE